MVRLGSGRSFAGLAGLAGLVVGGSLLLGGCSRLFGACDDEGHHTEVEQTETSSAVIFKHLPPPGPSEPLPPTLVDAPPPGPSEPLPPTLVDAPPPGSSEPSPPTLVDQLYVSPHSIDFSRNPKLLERITASPHGYFRFINAPFSQAVCTRFHGASANAPLVNLHGDAHLEQYAVTEAGRGLTDFDDSSRGPATLDLIRFGVSIHLALSELAPEVPAEPLFERFLAGYRTALEMPEEMAPCPQEVSEIRKSFSSKQLAYFKWIDSLMIPVSSTAEAAFKTAFEPYREAMLIKYPGLKKNYFHIERMGRFQIGIGSALDEKYLIRVRGPSDAVYDDVVLEAKEVRSLAGISCVENVLSEDPFRILLANSRIAYRPHRYLGYIEYRSQKFWLHSWARHYKELTLADLKNIEDLEEIVFDVGTQLGRGHPKIAGEFEHQLRQAQLRFIDKYQQELQESLSLYSRAVVRAWLRFKSEL